MADRNHLRMTALTKLALVDNPANQHAEAVIAKRHESGAIGKAMRSFVAKLRGIVAKDAQTYPEARAVSELWEKANALQSTIADILSDDTESDKRAKVDAALSAFRDDVLSGAGVAKAVCAKCGGVMKDNVCKDCGGKVAKAAEPDPAPTPAPAAPAAPVVKAAPATPTEPTPTPGAPASQHTEPAPGATPMKKVEVTKFTDLALAQAHIEKLTSDLNAANDANEALAKAASAADPIGEITKGMTETAAKAYRDSQERIAKLEAQAATNVRVAKAERIGKGVISGEDGTNGLVAVLKTLDGVASADERKVADDFVTKLLAQHAEVLKLVDGLELGTSEVGAGASRQEKIDKAASELMKADPKLTKAQATDRALANDPSLYDEGEPEDTNAE